MAFIGLSLVDIKYHDCFCYKSRAGCQTKVGAVLRSAVAIYRYPLFFTWTVRGGLPKYKPNQISLLSFLHPPQIMPGPVMNPIRRRSNHLIPNSHLLSIEIIKSVINFRVSTDDYTLKSCSLLSRFFLPVARKHLFNTITIYCRRRRYKLRGWMRWPFLNLNSSTKSSLSNPEIPSYIKNTSRYSTSTLV